MGRLVAAHAGVEPRYMGIGPVPAVRQVLEKANLKVDDIDVFEVNEAFAAQALAVVRDLSLPEDRTNPNGSGVSLGRDRATGCILTVKALYELKRQAAEPGDHVHRRRPGHRGDLRGGGMSPHVDASGGRKRGEQTSADDPTREIARSEGPQGTPAPARTSAQPAAAAASEGAACADLRRHRQGHRGGRRG